MYKQPLKQLQGPTFISWGCQKEKRKQEIGTLFEKIVKENFPNLVKEIDMQVQRVPNKMNAKRHTPRHII